MNLKKSDEKQSVNDLQFCIKNLKSLKNTVNVDQKLINDNFALIFVCLVEALQLQPHYAKLDFNQKKEDQLAFKI